MRQVEDIFCVLIFAPETLWRFSCTLATQHITLLVASMLSVLNYNNVQIESHIESKPTNSDLLETATGLQYNSIQIVRALPILPNDGENMH